MFEAKGQPRLLHDLPQHRLAAGREAFLQSIAPGHEVVDACARAERMPDPQRMGDDAGPLASIGVGKPALIGVNPVALKKVIEIADDAVASAGSQELKPALSKAALDQQAMEHL